jgi:hypothetical protein
MVSIELSDCDSPLVNDTGIQLAVKAANSVQLHLLGRPQTIVYISKCPGVSRHRRFCVASAVLFSVVCAATQQADCWLHITVREFGTTPPNLQ